MDSIMVVVSGGAGVGGVYMIMLPLVWGGGKGVVVVGVYSIIVPLVGGGGGGGIVEVAHSGEPVGHSCLITKRPRALSGESLLSNWSFKGCKIARG